MEGYGRELTHKGRGRARPPQLAKERCDAARPSTPQSGPSCSSTYTEYGVRPSYIPPRLSPLPPAPPRLVATPFVVAMPYWCARPSAIFVREGAPRHHFLWASSHTRTPTPHKTRKTTSKTAGSPTKKQLCGVCTLQDKAVLGVLYAVSVRLPYAVKAQTSRRGGVAVSVVPVSPPPSTPSWLRSPESAARRPARGFTHDITRPTLLAPSLLRPVCTAAQLLLQGAIVGKELCHPHSGKQGVVGPVIISRHGMTPAACTA